MYRCHVALFTWLGFSSPPKLSGCERRYLSVVEVAATGWIEERPEEARKHDLAGPVEGDRRDKNVANVAGF